MSKKIEKTIMPPDPCLERIFMVSKVFEPLKFYCISYFIDVYISEFGLLIFERSTLNETNMLKLLL